MLKNYLKTTFRNFKKNKVFVIINTLGLGIAIACCIVAYLNYDFGVSYDDDQPNLESVYRVNIKRDFQGFETNYGISPMPLGPIVKDNFSEMSEVVRVNPVSLGMKMEEDVFSTQVYMVDPGFLKIFQFDFIQGDPTALQQKSGLVITNELAIKYFGTTDVIGKQVSSLVNEMVLNFTITGVIKKPQANSSFYFQALAHIDHFFDYNEEGLEDDWKSWSTLLVKLNEGADIPSIEKRLDPFKKNQNAVREDFKVSSFYLDPFQGMALRSEAEDVRGHWFRSSMPTPALYAPLYMAIAILLIACFNFTNTSIAISSKRLKEIGIRKVMGSIRIQLIYQFLIENIVLCLMGLLVGLGIAYFLVPVYSNLWPFIELELNVWNDWQFFGVLLVILIFTGVIAGSYPAFYISSFEPTTVLKGNAKFNGTNAFTRILLFFQYFFCTIALIMGIGFLNNAKFQRNLDLGYNTSNIIYQQVSNKGDYDKLANALMSETSIEEVAGTEHHFYSSYVNDPIKYEDQEHEVDIMRVGHDYIGIMDIELLEGRGFQENSESDRRESAIVNEEFVKRYDLSNPIGARLVWQDTIQLYVIGVVKDFYTSAFWDPIDPLIFKYGEDEDWQTVIVRAKDNNLENANERFQAIFQGVFPNKMYNGRFMDQEIQEALEVNTNIVKIFGFLAVIALLLTSIGLYSLVSLNILKRMKEVGVRKVLGGSVSHIVEKLSKEFLIILLIATVPAAVSAYFLTSILLGSIFSYYLPVQIWVAVSAVVILFVVSAITLGGKVIKAAIANPIHALKSE